VSPPLRNEFGVRRQGDCERVTDSAEVVSTLKSGHAEPHGLLIDVQQEAGVEPVGQIQGVGGWAAQPQRLDALAASVGDDLIETLRVPAPLVPREPVGIRLSWPDHSLAVTAGPGAEPAVAVQAHRVMAPFG
jgi:hypothetical protein